MSDDNTNQIINPADPSLMQGVQTAAPAVQLSADEMNDSTSTDNTDANEPMGGFNLSISDPIQNQQKPTVVSTAPEPATATNINEGDPKLLELKQQALQQLTPLVDKLDQEPLEKFRTTMMMIQANDDKTLINSAFSTAQKIIDDKERAQALLDIINEINYFTNR